MNQGFMAALTSYAVWRRNQFVQATQDPFRVQDSLLKKLLHRHRYTERGHQLGLATIRSVDEFRDRLPVTEYHHYEADIQRIAAGEGNILTPDPVRFLTITSGTTGARKYIPVTRPFQAALQKANIASMGFGLAELRQRGQSLGRLLITNSVRISGTTSGGIDYGLASTGSIRTNKLLAGPLFAHPYDILQISDSRTRQYLCLLFGLRCRNLQSIAANFPMLLLRTCRYLETEAEALIQDLRRGTIAADLDLTPACRQSLEQRWFAQPQRADELETCLREQGRLTPQRAWPYLSLLTTARGGTSNFYFERFPEYFGDTPVFGGVYGCSEATFGISPAFNQDGCVLALESGFFEFVPQSEWDAAHPQTLLPAEVKVGDRYRILVTTAAGFYRYDIKDVVEVVGFFEKTPLIVFRHRLGGQLNSTSEKTTEFHVTQVMQQLQAEFGLRLDDFCVTLSKQDIPAHYWVNIELAPHHSLNDPQRFLERFDNCLKQENQHYQIMRQDQVPPPQLRILQPGSFERLRQRLLRQGAPENQLKLPHISEDRGLLDEFTVVQEISGLHR